MQKWSEFSLHKKFQPFWLNLDTNEVLGDLT